MKNRVLVIVVTYNAEKWVDYCFQGLLNSNIGIDIICIDNNSSDKTTDLMREKFPEVALIESPDNQGFGKANNIGLGHCLKNGYDYAFLLNQDASVESDTIEKLVSIQQKNPAFGILSPLQRSKDNDSLEHIFSHWLGENNTPGLISDFVIGKSVKPVYETKFVNAAIWLISKECLLSVRAFDSDFPHYGEDNEFIHRAAESGFKTGICPSVHANHARPKSLGGRIEGGFSKRQNRSYVDLLVQFKTSPLSPKKRCFYFSRRMLVDLFRYTVLFDYDEIKIAIKSYYKLFFKRAS